MAYKQQETNSTNSQQEKTINIYLSSLDHDLTPCYITLIIRSCVSSRLDQGTKEEPPPSVLGRERTSVSYHRSQGYREGGTLSWEQ